MRLAAIAEAARAKRLRRDRLAIEPLLHGSREPRALPDPHCLTKVHMRLHKRIYLHPERAVRVLSQEAAMTAQIINLAEYRKAKEAEEVRKIVNDYFAAHSQAMAWWVSRVPVG